MHDGYIHLGYMHHGYMHVMKVEKEVVVTFAWVTRLECPKDAKDEVKRPKGLQLENRACRAPRLLVDYIS